MSQRPTDDPEVNELHQATVEFTTKHLDPKNAEFLDVIGTLLNKLIEKTDQNSKNLALLKSCQEKLDKTDSSLV